MKTQVFKGQKLTRTKVKNNILRIWDLCDHEDKYDWYQEAHNFAQDSREDLNKVCGYIAALSPMKTWEQNKKCVLDYIQTDAAGHMKTFVNKCHSIKASGGTDEEILSILNGNKIKSFYLNIRYPNKANHITIDRHALSCALGYWVTEKDYSGITKNQYAFFVECFTLAAMKVNVSPLLMQSATWVKWRKIKKEY